MPAALIFFGIGAANSTTLLFRYSVLNKILAEQVSVTSLLKKASFEWLLLLDADTIPLSKQYLRNYIPLITKANDSICGGTAYRSEAPEPERSLRWIFGKAREERTAKQRNKHPFDNFTLNNLLIRKDVMQKFPLDDAIQTYGHEDTLLGMHLMTAKITLVHTDNFVYHEGLDTNYFF